MSDWTTSTVSAAEYLRGLVGITISDNALQSILLGRGYNMDTQLCDIDQQTAELLKADLFVWFCTTPSTGGSVEDSDGNWKHKEGSYALTAYDKSYMLSLANTIYQKYGEETVTSTSKVTLINL